MPAGQQIVPPDEPALPKAAVAAAAAPALPAGPDLQRPSESGLPANAERKHSFARSARDWFARAFNTAVLQKNRLAWVDYLRGIAILLVVYRHVLLGIQNSGYVLPAAYLNANIMFFSFRMPLFFILSGVFISGSLAKKSLGRIVYSKFELLLYPYLIWATVQITIQIFASHYTNANRTAFDYLYIFYQPEKIDQFWYLPALFNS
ncbi:MAG TPA: acyltransferase, partial [Puia sp.]|nr:acyltransferase [Puia sp.]